MCDLPRHVHRLSALWWEMVDTLVEGNFPKEMANSVVGEFFTQFIPIPRDRVRLLEGEETEE